VQGVSFLGSGIHLKKGEDLHTICALGPENTEITFWLSEHFHFSIAVQHLFILICTMYLVVQSNGHLRMFICVGQCKLMGRNISVHKQLHIMKHKTMNTMN